MSVVTKFLGIAAVSVNSPAISNAALSSPATVVFLIQYVKEPAVNVKLVGAVALNGGSTLLHRLNLKSSRLPIPAKLILRSYSV